MGGDDLSEDHDEEHDRAGRIDPESAVDAVLALLNAGNEVAGRQVLTQRAATLCSDRAEEVFDRLLLQYAADEGAVRHIGAQRQRVRDARDRGVAAAYAEVLTPDYARSLGQAFQAMPVDDMQRIQAGSALAVLAEEGGDADRARAWRHEVGRTLARAALRSPPHRSLEWLEAASQWLDRDAAPAEWARAQHNLGELLRQLEEPGAVERAIDCFEHALEVFTPQAAPVDRGLALNSLGAAWLSRRSGVHEDNIDRGIVALEAALLLRPREHYPAHWCKTSLNLGSAYDARQHGDAKMNAAEAIRHLEAALGPEAEGLDPVLLTRARGLLAKRLASRGAEGGDAAEVRRAVAIAEQALAEAGPGAVGGDIATLHALVAEALDEGTTGSRDPEQALSRYEAALDAGQDDARWTVGRVLAEQSLGRLHEFRQAGDRTANLKVAIAHYETAAAIHDGREVAELAAVCRYWASQAWGKRRDLPREQVQHEVLLRLRAAVGQYPDAAPASLRITMRIAFADALCDSAAGDRGMRIEEAIGWYEAALTELQTDGDRDDRIRAHSGLGIALLERPKGDRADNLERAIGHQRQVLAICSREHDAREWALAQHNLGNVYAERTRESRRDNLEQAIACFEAALSVWKRDEHPEDWAMTQNSCAGALALRIAGDRADNIERALARYAQALEVYTREAHPQDWAMTQHNLALAWLQRVEGDRDVNVENGIAALQASLEFRTRDALPYFWAMTQANLGNAWQERRVGDHKANRQRALEHFRRAQQVYTREAYPADWAWIELSLGASALLPRVQDRIDGLRQALQVYTRERQPERWALGELALGHACAERDAGEPAGSPEAVLHFEAALQGLDPIGQPAHRSSALAGLGDLCMRAGQWERALGLHDEAMAIGEQAFEAAYTPDGQLAATAALAPACRQSAWCLWQLGRCADALLRLDSGRTRLLRLDLARDDADLATLPEDLRDRLKAARHAVRTLASEARQSYAELAAAPAAVDWRDLGAHWPNAERHEVDGGGTVWSVPLRDARGLLATLGLGFDVAARLDEARAALRVAQAQAFAVQPALRPRDLDEAQLLELIPPGGALVAFMLSSHGAAAWVLPAGTGHVDASHAVPLAGDTLERLQAHLDGDDDAPGWVDLLRTPAPDDIEAAAERERHIADRTGDLWPLLMAPVQARLEALGMGTDTPVLLVPHGALGLLPLHAAWREVGGWRRCFLDDHVVAFAPGFVAARTARARAGEARRHARTLLAVGDPLGDLPHARVECAAVAACFPPAARCLVGADATVGAVEAAVGGAAYLHFATHGRYSSYDVMRSHLVLAGGGRLNLARVVSPEFDLSKTRLVVLAACDSGLREASRTPDEFLGLPGGFIEGGAAGVVSALWSINDASTARLFATFYRSHLDDGLPVAVALREAQRSLRDATVESLGLAQTWEAAYLASIGDAPDPHAYGMMRWCRANPQARPYASPYHWAAFVFNGG